MTPDASEWPRSFFSQFTKNCFYFFEPRICKLHKIFQKTFILKFEKIERDREVIPRWGQSMILSIIFSMRLRNRRFGRKITFGQIWTLVAFFDHQLLLWLILWHNKWLIFELKSKPNSEKDLSKNNIVKSCSRVKHFKNLEKASWIRKKKLKMQNQINNMKIFS